MKLPLWKTETDDLWLEIKSAYFNLLIRAVSYDKPPRAHPRIYIDVIVTIRSRDYSICVKTRLISSLEFSYLRQNLNCLSNKDLNGCSLESVGRNLILSNCLGLLSTASLINFFLSKISPNHPYPFKPLHPTVPPFVISSASQFLKNKTNRLESSIRQNSGRDFILFFFLERNEGGKRVGGLI